MILLFPFRLSEVCAYYFSPCFFFCDLFGWSFLLPAALGGEEMLIVMRVHTFEDVPLQLRLLLNNLLSLFVLLLLGKCHAHLLHIVFPEARTHTRRII